jgi:Zn-dependent protease
MTNLTTIQTIAVLALPLIFAITLHEVAHGFVASLFGDQTAKLSGRLTINPIKHIDLVGTIIAPLVMFLFTNFIFGWAKPVPVDSRNLHNPKRDMAFVALAGPVSNLLMALFWGLIAKIGVLLSLNGNSWVGDPLNYMGQAGILINVFLAVLNLVPIPPLDGGKVLEAILPRRAAYTFSQLEPYGFLILILLLLSGVLLSIMSPFISLIIRGILQLFGLELLNAVF